MEEIYGFQVLLAGIYSVFMETRKVFVQRVLLEDIYLEKQKPNIVLILAIIFIQAFYIIWWPV